MIKELQKIELDILKDFIRVCEELNLNYYLIGGTLIGAVRHKGFIPWDDDIDVCMLRKEYDIFIEKGQKLLNKNFFLQTYRTDKEYSNSFAKIRNSNTTFIETSVKNKKMNQGIFIDIFPIDNYYHYNTIKVKMLNYLIHPELINNRKLIKTISLLVYKVFYSKKTKEDLCKELEKIYVKNNNKKSNKVSNYGGAWGTKRETHRIECFKNYKTVKFEKIDVKIPIGYDEMLTTTYGDYMKLPPKEKQVTHHYTDIIDTKKSYKEYININKEK